MNLAILLFIISSIGFILNRRNIIMLLICLEIILLSITLMILINGYEYDDIITQTYAVYIICIQGAESAIGLAILLAYYRLTQSISITSEN
jgi:NADH-ubiquinone oxidoreductase chain 4L